MPDALVARQPIFNTRLDVVGYELLFRSGALDRAEVLDNDGATATVMMSSLTEFGVERLVGTTAAWINVSREFILGGYAALLPGQLFVLELLEDQLIDAELVRAIQELTDMGYLFALDDFAYEASLEPLIDLASYVKLDLRASGEAGFAQAVERLSDRGVTLLAEKLETYEEHRLAASLGCELFQGYFYCRPQTIRGARVDADRLSLLKLLAVLQDPVVELEDLDHAIGSDPRLGYRLLRYMNSAFFGLACEVRSIRQAVALLGIDNLKRWATLNLFAMVDGKPGELTRTALTRARFCELAGAGFETGVRGELFTVGLLSVIDALLDLPLPEVLQELPLAGDLADALLDQRGPYGDALRAVIALETGDYRAAEGLIPDAEELYLDSTAWADEATESLLPAGVAVAG